MWTPADKPAEPMQAPTVASATSPPPALGSYLDDDESPVEGGESARLATSAGEMSSNLHVRGLPPSLGEQEFRQVFENFGVLISYKLMVDIKTGVSRGFGFVLFRDPEDAAKAVRDFDGFDPFGTGEPLSVTVAPASTRVPRAPSNRLFMRNLPSYTTEAEVRAMCEAHGTIRSLEMAPEGDESTSLVLVEMADAQEAQAVSRAHNNRRFAAHTVPRPTTAKARNEVPRLARPLQVLVLEEGRPYPVPVRKPMATHPTEYFRHSNPRPRQPMPLHPQVPVNFGGGGAPPMPFHQYSHQMPPVLMTANFHHHQHYQHHGLPVPPPGQVFVLPGSTVPHHPGGYVTYAPSGPSSGLPPQGHQQQPVYVVATGPQAFAAAPQLSHHHYHYHHHHHHHQQQQHHALPGPQSTMWTAGSPPTHSYQPQ